MSAVLRLDNVCKKFGGVTAAKNISLSLSKGEICGLIGPNGAGKTTMMNLISGIYDVDSGSIMFDNKDVTKMPAYMRARMGIGRTFQTPRFMHRSSIKDNLMMGTDLRDQIGYFSSFLGTAGTSFNNELSKLLELAGFTLDWEEDVMSIPFGKRKMLEIIRSILANPKVMLVDEPAAGLTTQEIENARNLLTYASKEKGIGVLFIEHQMDLVMGTCENINVLAFGEIIASGKPKEISSNPLVLEAYLGRDFNA